MTPISLLLGREHLYLQSSQKANNQDYLWWTAIKQSFYPIHSRNAPWDSNMNSLHEPARTQALAYSHYWLSNASKGFTRRFLINSSSKSVLQPVLRMIKAYYVINQDIFSYQMSANPIQVSGTPRSFSGGRWKPRAWFHCTHKHLMSHEEPHGMQDIHVSREVWFGKLRGYWCCPEGGSSWRP